ncbi:MAG: ParB/RepB/Spo0J family partition protein [Anaerovoracaceae bacterium]
MAATKNRGLGRGLDALFADQAPVNKGQMEDEAIKTIVTKSGEMIVYINIHEIKPNENQPRKRFNEEKLEELARSIETHGIIQPIVVRKKKNGYEIVAGERRWRAARKADLKEIPCIVREFDDEQNMLIAIIENMQREDLNAVEEAEGLHQMIATYGLTQEQVSISVGKSRPYITNSLRLLKLPEEIREKLADGDLTAGHARALINIEDSKVQRQICERIIKEGLSVRETEKLASTDGKTMKKHPVKKVKNADTQRVEYELKEALGTKININQNGKKGKIEIEYYSNDELERLIELLKSLR